MHRLLQGVDDADGLDRDDLVRRAATAAPHLELVVELVKDLVGGLPPGVIGTLDALRRDPDVDRR